MLIITLKEYQSQEIPRESISCDLQEKLCREYSKQIEIDPTFSRSKVKYNI